MKSVSLYWACAPTFARGDVSDLVEIQISGIKSKAKGVFFQIIAIPGTVNITCYESCIGYTTAEGPVPPNPVDFPV